MSPAFHATPSSSSSSNQSPPDASSAPATQKQSTAPPDPMAISFIVTPPVLGLEPEPSPTTKDQVLPVVVTDEEEIPTAAAAATSTLMMIGNGEDEARSDGDDSCSTPPAAVEVLHAARLLFNLATTSARRSEKGKGKDPEIYGTQADAATINKEDGNVPAANIGTDARFMALVGQYVEDELARLASSQREKSADDSSSDSEDAAAASSAQIAFSVSCHGNRLRYLAPEGNAVHALPARRGERSHHDLDDGEEAEANCERCKRARCYMDGCRHYDSRGFVRGDTVSVDGSGDGDDDEDDEDG